VSAQKSAITDTSYKKWSTVNSETLSSDGKFLSYQINFQEGDKSSFVISTDKFWHKDISNINTPMFSDNSRYLFGIVGSDSLMQMELGTDKINLINLCNGYELFDVGKNEWLIYQTNDTQKSLVITNLEIDKKFIINNVQEYFTNRNWPEIFFKTSLGVQNINLLTGKITTICNAINTTNFVFDNSGNHVAFCCVSDGKTKIWVYKRGEKKAKVILDGNQPLPSNMNIEIDENWRFSTDGKSLFFSLFEQKTTPESENHKVEAEVWSYKDLFLLPKFKQRKNASTHYKFLSILNIETGNVKKLLTENQKVLSHSSSLKSGEILIVESLNGGMEELSWNKSTDLSYYLCYSTTGKFIPIKQKCKKPLNMLLSPDNRYLVYFDPEPLQYISYDIKNNKAVVISADLKYDLCNYNLSARDFVPIGAGLVGWISNEPKVIVQGMYDIWELDLANLAAPLNLTNGIGEKNNIIFSFSSYLSENRILNSNEEWPLFGFNLTNKEQGLYRFNRNTLKLKNYYKTSNYIGYPYQVIPYLSKSKYADSYLLKYGSVNHSPNYLFTKDFKKFDTLSNISPEKAYNWITSELISYKDTFGNTCEGILYKPEDFDSTKKYPVVFKIYIEQSTRLNEYIMPTPAEDGINIPLLVSSGYLIFKPNIYTAKRRPGEAALVSVMAAANALSRFKWVDSARMAVTGHSFGGFETNYIISHTNRFKAAIAGAGVTNLIDNYARLARDGGDNRDYVMNGPYRMVDKLEDNPENYMKNSSLLDAKNFNTPLLLIHNNKDNAVPVNNSLQLFLILRTLQKPVWLLQYKDEMHTLEDVENKIDCQDKVKSYFDYFLKDGKLPDWMSKHN
jgi:predicted peptidase